MRALRLLFQNRLCVCNLLANFLELWMDVGKAAGEILLAHLQGVELLTHAAGGVVGETDGLFRDLRGGE